MRRSCNQKPTPSNTAEIVESESSYKLSPLPSNRFELYCFEKGKRKKTEMV